MRDWIQNETDLKYFVERDIESLDAGCYIEFGWTHTYAKMYGHYYRLHREYVGGNITYNHTYENIDNKLEDVLKEENLIYDGRSGSGNGGYITLMDALRLMMKGQIVRNERYNAQFRIKDGKLEDHWPEDEPDAWFEFDVNNYQNGKEILTHREVVSWMAEP